IGVEIDGCRIEDIPFPKSDHVLHLRRDDTAKTTSATTTATSQSAVSSWRVIDATPAALKGPNRSGPFKLALNHRFMLVYGTRGNDEENAWAMAKARFDSEMW